MHSPSHAQEPQHESDARFTFHDRAPALASFRAEVLEGLAEPHKAIPCRFLYDARGSRLFDLICEQPEYYPTRTELGILEAHADELAALAGAHARLIELGTGSSRKVRVLLDALAAPAAYVSIDISREALRAAALDIARSCPQVEVHAICADYLQAFELPAIVAHDVEGAQGRRVAFFPGSTIGNLERAQAQALLAAWCERLGRRGAMIVGVDLVKPIDVLERAYDDAAGVTAAFSKNLLVRANRELGADFRPALFRHEARWVPQHGCIEIHLVSLAAQRVHVAGQTFRFEQHERLHVENSHKYSIEEFAAIATRAGFASVRWWSDAARRFAVFYLGSESQASNADDGR